MNLFSLHPYKTPSCIEAKKWEQRKQYKSHRFQEYRGLLVLVYGFLIQATTCQLHATYERANPHSKTQWASLEFRKITFSCNLFNKSMREVKEDMPATWQLWRRVWEAAGQWRVNFVQMGWVVNEITERSRLIRAQPVGPHLLGGTHPLSLSTVLLCWLRALWRGRLWLIGVLTECFIRLTILFR